MRSTIFLFSVNIWGTVSDWCMIVITAITAYYLYRTLKSQKEVQATQTKLFEIESIRFRESIKPVLRYSVSKIKFQPNDENKEILSIEVINETDSIALEIKTDRSDNENAKQIFIPTDLSSMRDHLVKGDKPLILHFILESVNRINYIVFALTYKDVAGTKYKQGVFCISDSLGKEINPFLPEIVN